MVADIGCTLLVASSFHPSLGFHHTELSFDLPMAGTGIHPYHQQWPPAAAAPPPPPAAAGPPAPHPPPIAPTDEVTFAYSILFVFPFLCVEPRKIIKKLRFLIYWC